VNHCDYSRWASVDKIRSVSSETVIPVLKELFSKFGTPLVYKTDNGPPFQSFNFANFAKQWGFKHRRVTPYWPRANGEVESFMKKLNKVVKSAEVAGIDRDRALQIFLKAYRETPHSTTKVPPAILMMGFSRSSGIPQFESTSFDAKRLAEYHKIARENDRAAKERMRIEYNMRMRVIEPIIVRGSRVLVKNEKRSKTTPLWDPNPFVVTNIKGSMVTAERYGKVITRNSSCFKLFRFDNRTKPSEPTVNHDRPSEPTDNPLLVETPSNLINSNDQVESPDVQSQSPSAQVEAQASQLSSPMNSATGRVEPQGDLTREANSPTKPSSGSSQTVPPIAKAKVGRPTKEEAALREQARQAELKARRDVNPPERQSNRIANKKPK
jgi:hypothetical protein